MTYSEVKNILKDISKDELRNLLDNFDEDLILQYYNSGCSLSNMEEAYQGKWNNDEEFVQEMLESLGDIPKDLPCYVHIDWEHTARDIMMDYFEIDGHYFRNM